MYKTDSIRFNGGSETDRHLVCKAQVAWFLSQQGYRICSEVKNDAGTAEADILAYGNGEPPFIVETETGLTDDVKATLAELEREGKDRTGALSALDVDTDS